MVNDVMLTTIDNPFDPFDDFDSWFQFDVEKGYNSCAMIARIDKSTPDMSIEEDMMETERVIDEIIKNDFLNIYKKVSRPAADY